MPKLTTEAHQLAPSMRGEWTLDRCTLTWQANPRGPGLSVQLKTRSATHEVDVFSGADIAAYESIRSKLDARSRYAVDIHMAQYIDRSDLRDALAVRAVRMWDARLRPWLRTTFKAILALRPPLLAVVFLIVVGAGYSSLVWYPQWRTQQLLGLVGSTDGPSQLDLSAAEEQAVRTGAQLLTGVVVVITLLVAYLRTLALERQTASQSEAAATTARLTESGQVTDRFAKAIELLSSDKEDSIAGAVYALERIARDSERDHITVVEVLMAHLRRHATKEAGAAPNPRVQVIMSVLGRRLSGVEDTATARREGPLYQLDLSNLDLSGVKVLSGEFRLADFRGSVLRGAVLRGCHFEGAYFFNSDLEGTDFQYAHFGDYKGRQLGATTSLISMPTPFQGAAVRGTNFFACTGLTYSNFQGARLSGKPRAPTRTPPTWWAKGDTDSPFVVPQGVSEDPLVELGPESEQEKDIPCP